MSRALILFFVLCTALLQAQSKSLLANLAAGDSVVCYQCHVETATVTLQTAQGQTLSGSSSLNSITEKFVIKKTADAFQLFYYTSDYTQLPNRRFSGLKIREKEYWHFTLQAGKLIEQTDVDKLESLLKDGREAIEYDFVISKYTQNQIILKRGKRYRQLVFDKKISVYELFELEQL